MHDIDEDLQRILDIATPEELQVIYDVAERAGILWQCECGYMNGRTSACSNCDNDD